MILYVPVSSRPWEVTRGVWNVVSETGELLRSYRTRHAAEMGEAHMLLTAMRTHMATLDATAATIH